MHSVLEFLASQPILLAFLLIGIGSVVGHIKVRSISLGAAAVLFCSIALSAFGASLDVTLEVPEILGTIGLVLFAYTVGVISGANFFASLRKGWRPITVVVIILVAAAGVAWALGKLLGLDGPMTAGAFAGAVTNTPALGAALEATSSQSPTVGYAVTYIFGVLGMLFFAIVALRRAPHDRDTPEKLVTRTVRIETEAKPSFADLEDEYEDEIRFSRVRHGEENPVEPVDVDDVIRPDDLVTVVGSDDNVSKVISELGHTSSHNLVSDRSQLDFRRVTVSNSAITGLTIEELDLDPFEARVTRVRRGDVDMLAQDSLVLQAGDRVRVIAPKQNMAAVSAYFGDSARGLSDINPAGLAIGLALGVFVGWITIPIPGAHFALGSAAGSLIVGLVFGRLRRIGPLTTTLPVSSAQALTELGLLLFLAQAGTRAGTQIATAFSSGDWIKILLLGFVVTTMIGASLFFVMRRVFKVGGTQLSGMIAGVQTQPAVLAYANDKTGSDPRVALGYALVYPAAMITKILLGHLLGMLS